MTWADSHCHLDGDPAAATVLAEARGAGVELFVTVGTDATTSAAAIELATRHPDVWATVGVHPHEASQGVDGLVELLDDERVLAVGEAGLDYHYDHSPRDVQRAVFAAQVGLAHERDLALVIHTREAWADTFAILATESPPARTIFHCFTGGPEEAERCLAIGARLSFSGIVTFPKATDVHAAARLCPSDRLLVETDSPYLTPVPHRGRRNQPAYVALVGEALARLRETTTEAVASATLSNTRVAFRVPPT